ncbi:MAG: formamidopyrimidine-DNA glycosylase [Betaproteobacteria bacterium]|nr:formamidopyrimidine-DNA glycosylase [Betaproteobacteria bacterium]
MPELPDITVYCESLERLLAGATLKRLQVQNVFVLRSFDPPVAALEGKKLMQAERIGKRIVFGFEDDLFVVVHLMIAGRLKWLVASGRPAANKAALARFEFDRGTLLLTEAGSKRRASLHVVQGRAALAAHDPGGVDPFACDVDEFVQRVLRENHTLKRTLTDPHLFSGIGNAYSDEILHAARLSPLMLSQKLSREEAVRLHAATQEVMSIWLARLRREAGEGMPEKVTAFRAEMAVHGKFRQPCPECGTLVARIVYSENECNYCPRCQTGGKLLADRALSQLLKDSWPKSIDD